jgi:hypothetical protein
MPERLTSALRRMPRRFPWRIERPVFIIAPPRSGSTLLFECLAQFPEFTAFTDREGTFIWRRVLPYDKRRTVSDFIAPDEFSAWRRLQVKSFFYAISALRYPAERRRDRFQRLVRQPRMRYLDKTISNCFRLDLIQEMFPDASFVFLTRDPRSNIASMISGWPELQRFGKPVLTEYVRAVESTVPHWTYAAPPGWRGVLDRELAEICAWSWQQHAEEILRFRESVTPGHLLRYEDLVQDPVSAVTSLAGELDLEVTDDIVRYLKRPPLSRTTLTPPTATADIQPNVRAQVEAVLPTVSTTAKRFGY